MPIPKPSEELMTHAKAIADQLKQKGIRCKIDDDPKKRPGFKFAEHEMKGTPIRIGIGQRDLDKGVAEVARRDTKEKTSIPLNELSEHIHNLLEEIQSNLFTRSKKFRDNHVTRVDDFDSFKDILESKGGFISAHWDGTVETEMKVKELTKATIRCIPLDNEKERGKCVLTGKPSEQRVLFAKAY